MTAPTTSITVTDSADSQAETEIKPKAERSQGRYRVKPVQQVAAASPLAEIPGVDKSAVYKINPDDTVETLWSSKEENVYSLSRGLRSRDQRRSALFRHRRPRPALPAGRGSQGHA